MSNLKLNKLKFRYKNGTEVTLDISSNIIDDSNTEANFPHKSLLTNTNVWETCKDCANGSTTNIKFLKTQLSNMVQLTGLLDKLLKLLIKTSLLLTGIVPNLWLKGVLVLSGLTAAASSTDTHI